MILDEFAYVIQPVPTGDILQDTEQLLCANGKPKTFLHVSAVAEVNRGLAVRFGLDAEKCCAAGWLHDVSAVIAPKDMLQFAERHGMTLCEAERKYPFLLHQRLSKIVSETYFAVEDADILSAVQCHTTLKADANAYDMALFIADKLAWDQEGIPPFYDGVKRALDVSLEKACYVYMRYMEDSGKLLCPHENWTAAMQWLQNRI